jgi:putative nucleotidyltransferase with HDIG domain
MKKPPRLIARALTATVLTVTVVLMVTFVVLIVDTRDRVRIGENAKLDISSHLFTALDARRQHDQLAIVEALTETPALKAALEAYMLERAAGDGHEEDVAQFRRAVAAEVERLAERTKHHIVAVLDVDGRPLVVTGARKDAWDLAQRVDPGQNSDSFQQVIVEPGGAFRAYGARIRTRDDQAGADRAIGVLLVANSLDANYAQELSDLSNAGIVIAVDGRVAARTVAEPIARTLAERRDRIGRTALLNGEEYAIATLLSSGSTRIYTLSSIDAAARAATEGALVSLGSVAFGSFLLAMIASVWLARTLTRPIDRLVTEIETMTAAGDFDRTIEPTRASRELDSLANRFNELVRGLAAAEAETRTTYLGAIQALAATLDARDPYTAGHSERVSKYAVLIAQHLRLPEERVEVIRLGALLHDIGKIGVPDEILRKPGALTAIEFDQIKRHPTLGARILRQVPFLRPHLPIVELHHESPDGRGYPFGLRGMEIPLDARIVHVADAFDAMTSARAYRPARPASTALAELQLHAGTQFDSEVVAALHAVMPSASALSEFQLQELLIRGA